MSRTWRVFGGFSLGYLHLTLVTLVGLVLTPFLLATIGQHDYGLWLLGLQLVGYLQLVDLGVVAMLPREAAYAGGRASLGEAANPYPELVGRVRAIVRWQWPAIAAAALVVVVAFPADWAPLRAPFAWILACLVIVFPLRTRQAMLQGLQDLTFLGQLQLVAWAVGTVTLVGLVLAGFGLYALAAGWTLTQAVTISACWWRLGRRFPHAWPAAPVRVAWSDAREYLRRSIWVSVSQCAQVLLNGSDVLIVGLLLGPAAVVPYACTAKLLQVLANHPQMLMQAAAPALSELRIVAERDRLLSTTGALTRAMLILSGGVGAIVVAANGAFVSWWVGADLYGGLALTCALVVALICRHFNTAAVYSLFAFGHERRLSLTALADGIATVSASVVFVYWWGPIGAALGSAAGVLAVSLAPNLSALAREVGSTAGSLVYRQWPWGARFVVAAVVSLGLAQFVSPAGVWSVVMLALAAGTAYGLLVLPLLLEGPLGGYIRQLIDTMRLAAGSRRAAPGDVR